MKNNFGNFLFTLLLLLLSNLGWSQSNAIKIKFIGNCGLYLTDGTTNIYTDFPYKSGAYNYMEYDASELDSIRENSIFIFTHRHADHYSKKQLKTALKSKGGKKYGSWNIAELEALGTHLPEFSIQTFKTKHRFSISHYSYLITWHGKKIFLSGDTETAETIRHQKGLEWAFVPPWVIIDAMRKDIKIDTKMFGVYHLYPNQKINNDSPEKIKIMDTQGEVIVIPY
ncbi:MAG: hypothetical protein CL843_19440 [Crocinitomicaceae bacterium]|nr:hypothetical protein [Crocinitomicaceae bacterium]|tara:strand:+ start:11181 stop:11858 length:678 start_codon:yes stop_codon:yes gene_type:complete